MSNQFISLDTYYAFIRYRISQLSLCCRIQHNCIKHMQISQILLPYNILINGHYNRIHRQGICIIYIAFCSISIYDYLASAMSNQFISLDTCYAFIRYCITYCCISTSCQYNSIQSINSTQIVIPNYLLLLLQGSTLQGYFIRIGSISHSHYCLMYSCYIQFICSRNKRHTFFTLACIIIYRYSKL